MSGYLAQAFKWVIALFIFVAGVQVGIYRQNAAIDALRAALANREAVINQIKQQSAEALAEALADDLVRIAARETKLVDEGEKHARAVQTIDRVSRAATSQLRGTLTAATCSSATGSGGGDASPSPAAASPSSAATTMATGTLLQRTQERLRGLMQEAEIVNEGLRQCEVWIESVIN